MGAVLTKQMSGLLLRRAASSDVTANGGIRGVAPLPQVDSHSRDIDGEEEGGGGEAEQRGPPPTERGADRRNETVSCPGVIHI